MVSMGLWASTCAMDLAGRVKRSERGDVPGWVMITLMSALLVAALLAIAGPRLEELFNQAINRVSGLG
jgi:ABC-type transport system involved in cytochrome c biogenesis permease subunit